MTVSKTRDDEGRRNAKRASLSATETSFSFFFFEDASAIESVIGHLGMTNEMKEPRVDRRFALMTGKTTQKEG